MRGHRLEKSNKIAGRLFRIYYGHLKKWNIPAETAEKFSRWSPKAFGMLRKCRVLCSCWMCGNPRKYFGEDSLQEKRAMEMAEDQIQEFFSVDDFAEEDVEHTAEQGGKLP